MNKIFSTPWKIGNEAQRLLTYPLARLLFSFYGIPWGKKWRIYGLPIVQKHRQSQLTIGPNLQLRSLPGSNPLGANHPVILCTWHENSCLTIGANYGMTGGTICAATNIHIGNKVSVGANSIISDTDFHPLDPIMRQVHPQYAETAPILIENDVFIGMNCLVLKGVTIGCSSVIGAGSVVTKDIPAGVVAAGNPARVIKDLKVKFE
jgi:acetyltransferase-like isoleucine patch superfamily enzyme